MRLGLTQSEYEKLAKSLKKSKPVLGYRYWSVSRGGRLMAPWANAAKLSTSPTVPVKSKVDPNKHNNGSVWSPGINQSINSDVLYAFKHDNHHPSQPLCNNLYFEAHTGQTKVANVNSHTLVVGAVWMFGGKMNQVNELVSKYAAPAGFVLYNKANLQSQMRVYNASKFYNVPVVTKGIELKELAEQWLDEVFPYFFEEPYGVKNSPEFHTPHPVKLIEKHNEIKAEKEAKIKAKKEAKEEAKMKAKSSKADKYKERALKQYKEVKEFNDTLTFEDYENAIKILKADKSKGTSKYKPYNIAKTANKLKKQNDKILESYEKTEKAKIINDDWLNEPKITEPAKIINDDWLNEPKITEPAKIINDDWLND